MNPESGVVTVRATSRQHEKIQEFIDRVIAVVAPPGTDRSHHRRGSAGRGLPAGHPVGAPEKGRLDQVLDHAGLGQQQRRQCRYAVHHQLQPAGQRFRHRRHGRPAARLRNGQGAVQPAPVGAEQPDSPAQGGRELTSISSSSRTSFPTALSAPPTTATTTTPQIGFGRPGHDGHAARSASNGTVILNVRPTHIEHFRTQGRPEPEHSQRPASRTYVPQIAPGKSNRSCASTAARSPSSAVS